MSNMQPSGTSQDVPAWPEAGESPATLPTLNAQPSNRAPIPHGLAGAVCQADRAIRRLNTLLSSSSGQETILATINYSSEVLHYTLSSPPLLALVTRLRRSSPGLNTPLQQQPSATPPLLALSSLISETRTTLRLFGLASLWVWGSSTLESPPRDLILQAVAFSQVFVNVIYQVLENVAFLSSKGVMGRRIVERWGGLGKWYLWSTRAWFGHVVLEFVRLGRVHQLARKRREQRVELSSGTSVGSEEEDEENTRKRELRAWSKSLASNLAWAPLCVHWSLEQGIGVPQSLTGLISLIAGAWELRDEWSATEKL